MKLWIGITDGDWYHFLRAQPDLDEVNFWQPSGRRQFRALAPGEPLLFKLHSPDNFIVGGGFFATSSILPSSFAWKTFEGKNGAESLSQMRARIERYRRVASSRFEDYSIGCTILHAPFFFARPEWIPVPSDFKLNTQVGKTYDTASAAGRALWAEVSARLQARRLAQPGEVRDPLFGEPTLIRPRLGQGSFRVLVTDTYHRRCAVTGEKALPALDAAHIRPVSQGGQHRADNGLLLRSDIHQLFDSGYVSITPDYRFRVSKRLKDGFDNGEPYYPLQGKVIWRPRNADCRPSTEFLAWHADEIFRR